MKTPKTKSPWKQITKTMEIKEWITSQEESNNYTSKGATNFLRGLPGSPLGARCRRRPRRPWSSTAACSRCVYGGMCVYIYIYIYTGFKGDICAHTYIYIYIYIYICIQVSGGIYVYRAPGFRSVPAKRALRPTGMPNLPTLIIPTEIPWLIISGKCPMDVRIPPLKIKIMSQDHRQRGLWAEVTYWRSSVGFRV